jgi:hypothetical protein
MILMGKEETNQYWFIAMSKATKYYLCKAVRTANSDINSI